VNLCELGRRWALLRPDHLAVKCGSVELTYKALDDRADALARGLHAAGVGPGDRVGVLTNNRVELPETVIATLKLGAISVPLNVMLTARELAPIVMDSGCTIVITERALRPRLSAAVAEMPGLRIYSVDGGEGSAPASTLWVDGDPIDVCEVEPSAPAFICYTSGTTGVQKGAVLTHGSILPSAMAKAISEGLTFQERMLVPVALVYTGAMISCFMQITYFLGATLVLECSAEPEHLLGVIETERITIMTGVPVVYERMANSPSFEVRDISSLRSVTAGGAPVSLSLLEAFHAKGIPMIQSYGMTECSGLAAILDFKDAAGHIGFAGLPVLGTRIAVMDQSNHSLGPGEVGEICIRGPHVMKEYWGKPEMTGETVVDGWLHSGDLGLLDHAGFLKVVDRKKDMIISGGHNVYPAEIERALNLLPGVSELTVVGVPDERWGEVPMLVYVSDEDAEKVVSEVTRACEESLARYKWPKYLYRLEEALPRTFSGKISKPSLRERFSSVPPDALLLRRASQTTAQ
jgi:acyl-CoA synthetase (AMP-forming)/AMP-acid ligase II